MQDKVANWILLRGLTRESGHWGEFIVQFQQTQPSSRVIALDLPGNGQLHQLASPMHVQDIVAYCRSALASRNIAPPYHVLAMSLGAMVTVCWSQAYPQELSVQVLINTSMRPFSPFYQRLQPANYGALLKLALLTANPEDWERTVLRLTSNRNDRAVLPLWLAIRKQRPVSRANTLRQLLAAARFRASTTLPATPTLVLASAQDHLVSPECSKSLVKHWGCTLGLHPDAGHDLPLDDAPWVTAQVQQWLSSSG